MDRRASMGLTTLVAAIFALSAWAPFGADGTSADQPLPSSGPAQAGLIGSDGRGVIEESMRLRVGFGFPASRADVEEILHDQGLDPTDAGSARAAASEWGFILTAEEEGRIESREVLVAALRDAVPDLFTFEGYAGSYVDVTTDRFIVRYSAGEPSTVASELRAAGFTEAQVELKHTPHSSAQLTRLQEDLWKHASTLTPNPLSAIAEDVESNGLIITIWDGESADSMLEYVRQILDRDSVEYSIRFAEAVDSDCASRTDCEAPQRAEVRVSRVNSCSSGWVVNRSGVRYALTAGHCWFGENSDAVTSGGEHFGAQNADARCGSISSTNASKWSPTCGCTLYGMISADYSDILGDSGGAIANGTNGQYARGVHQDRAGSTRYFTSIGMLATYGLGAVATG